MSVQSIEQSHISLPGPRPELSPVIPAVVPEQSATPDEPRFEDLLRPPEALEDRADALGWLGGVATASEVDRQHGASAITPTADQIHEFTGGDDGPALFGDARRSAYEERAGSRALRRGWVRTGRHVYENQPKAEVWNDTESQSAVRRKATWALMPVRGNSRWNGSGALPGLPETSMEYLTIERDKPLTAELSAGATGANTQRRQGIARRFINRASSGPYLRRPGGSTRPQRNRRYLPRRSSTSLA